MNRMIKADLRRIMKKVSFYVWYGVNFIFIFIFSGVSEYSDQTMQLQYMTCRAILPLLVSIPVFLAVYGDEMKCGAMQCIIGRGISRRKVVLAKYLDCLLLETFYFVMIEIVMYVRNILFGIGYTPTQNITLAIFLFIIFIRIAGYLAFASFFVYLSWSTAPGVVALLTFAVIAKLALQGAQALAHIPIYNYTFDGLLDAGFAAVSAGTPAFQIVGALAFIAAALVLTVLVFRKKEIKF